MPPNLLLKAKYSFYSAIVFFLVANPEMYKALHTLAASAVGGSVADSVATSGGCPTPVGHALATLLFFLAMLALMAFPAL